MSRSIGNEALVGHFSESFLAELLTVTLPTVFPHLIRSVAFYRTPRDVTLVVHLAQSVDSLLVPDQVILAPASSGAITNITPERRLRHGRFYAMILLFRYWYTLPRRLVGIFDGTNDAPVAVEWNRYSSNELTRLSSDCRDAFTSIADHTRRRRWHDGVLACVQIVWERLTVRGFGSAVNACEVDTTVLVYQPGSCIESAFVVLIDRGWAGNLTVGVGFLRGRGR